MKGGRVNSKIFIMPREAIPFISPIIAKRYVNQFYIDFDRIYESFMENLLVYQKHIYITIDKTPTRITVLLIWTVEETNTQFFRELILTKTETYPEQLQIMQQIFRRALNESATLGDSPFLNLLI